jgi:hypothetical protein
MRTFKGFLAVVIIGPMLTVAGLASGEQTVKYAGTIKSISNGTIVVEDVGPWHGGRPETEITPREIVLAPSATFVVASRAKDGTTTFPGDYTEVPAQRSDLKPGTFVAVECQPTPDGCQLLKVTMVPPQPPE